MQPPDIYKFAAQYFTELVTNNPGLTADSPEEKAARWEADLLRKFGHENYRCLDCTKFPKPVYKKPNIAYGNAEQFLNADRSNVGSLPFAEFQKALHTRALALSSRCELIAVTV